MDGFYLGDIICSSSRKEKNFSFFTRKSKYSGLTILNFATIDWLLKHDHTSEAMLNNIKKFYKKYNGNRNYRKTFLNWINTNPKEYRVSTDIEGAMRVSAIGWFSQTIEEVKKLVEVGITPTHNSKEAKFLAEIVAVSIFMFRNNIAKKPFIKYMKDNYDINLNMSFEKLKKNNGKEGSKDLIIKALISVLEADDFEDAIRKSVLLGRKQQIVVISSSLAEAYFQEIPKETIKQGKQLLPKYFKDLLGRFTRVINEKHS